VWAEEKKAKIEKSKIRGQRTVINKVGRSKSLVPTHTHHHPKKADGATEMVKSRTE